MPSTDAIEAYLKKHAISEMLNGIVNELVETMPSDPISFLMSGLLKEASSRGQEPLLLQRLHELKQVMLKDQKEANGAVAQVAKLETDLSKSKYNITHLRKTIDQMEAGGGADSGSISTPAGMSGVPPGHTPFSWGAGISMSGAASATGGGAADDASSAGSLSLDSFSRRVRISKVLAVGKSAIGTKDVVVSGWARTIRMQSDLCFVALNDGSCMANLQLVVEQKLCGGAWDEMKKKGTTGCAITATGTIIESPAQGQVRSTSSPASAYSLNLASAYLPLLALLLARSAGGGNERDRPDCRRRV